MHKVHPHNDKIFNALEFVNEYIMIALTYIMLYFTNLVTIQDASNLSSFVPKDEEFSHWIQLTAIGLILLMSLINFLVMIKLSVAKLILACKKRKL